VQDGDSRPESCHWIRVRKQFFFEKKNQKTVTTKATP
jgi:hypothetical protein